MSISDQLPPSTPPAEPNPAVDQPILQPSKKSNKKWLVILVILISCVGVGVILDLVLQQKKPPEAVLDSFMKYMSAKDYERAYALFSPDGKIQTQLSTLKDLTEGDNYSMIEGYQKLYMQSIETVGDLQGTVAYVSGVINFQNNTQRTFTAKLEEVDGVWKIYSYSMNGTPGTE